MAAAGQSGAYLLEIIGVLAIAGLAALLTVPAATGAIGANRLAIIAANIASALVETRTRAIAGNRRELAVIEAGSGRVAAGGRAIALPPGLTMEILAAGSCPGDGRGLGIAFMPDGRSCGAVIRLADGLRRLRIRIDWYSGHVAIQRG